MKQRQYVYFIVLLNAICIFSQEEYCYSNDADKKQTKQFATKTPYEVAHGTEKNHFNVPSEALSTSWCN